MCFSHFNERFCCQTGQVFTGPLTFFHFGWMWRSPQSVASVLAEWICWGLPHFSGWLDHIHYHVSYFLHTLFLFYLLQVLFLPLLPFRRPFQCLNKLGAALTAPGPTPLGVANLSLPLVLVAFLPRQPATRSFLTSTRCLVHVRVDLSMEQDTKLAWQDCKNGLSFWEKRDNNVT